MLSFLIFVYNVWEFLIKENILLNLTTILNFDIILYVYFLQGGNFMNKKKKINTIVGSIGAFI